MRLVWFGLVWFYGISTIVGYLIPNPFNIYIFNLGSIFSNEPELIFLSSLMVSFISI